MLNHDVIVIKLINVKGVIVTAIPAYNRSVNSALVACDAQIATAVAQIQELRGPTGTGEPTTTDGTIAQARRALHTTTSEYSSLVYSKMDRLGDWLPDTEFSANLRRAEAEETTCRQEYFRLVNTYSALCGWDFNPATNIIRNTEG